MSATAEKNMQVVCRRDTLLPYNDLRLLQGKPRGSSITDVTVTPTEWERRVCPVQKLTHSTLKGKE